MGGSRQPHVLQLGLYVVDATENGAAPVFDVVRPCDVPVGDAIEEVSFGNICCFSGEQETNTWQTQGLGHGRHAGSLFLVYHLKTLKLRVVGICVSGNAVR